MTDEQLRALLRVKRFETPPPGYFDRLLTDLHRRQRSELLHRSLWRIALERWRAFFGEAGFGRLSSAASMAAVVLLGFLATGYWSEHRGGSAGSEMAMTAAQPVDGGAELASARSATNSALPVPKVDLSHLARAPFVADGHRVQTYLEPRYVIDALPAAYAPPSQF